MIDILVVGAGGFGQSVADAAIQSGQYRVKVFVDDRWAEIQSIWGIPVIGPVASLAGRDGLPRHAIIAIGNNTHRRGLHDRLLTSGTELVSIIHPSAVISPHAKIGRGAMIMARAVVGTGAVVADGAIVNTCAIVDHHAQVHAFAHLGAGACMPGSSVLGPDAWLQELCSLAPGEKVAAGTVIERSKSTND